MRQMVSFTLKNAGFNVVEAVDGGAAVLPRRIGPTAAKYLLFTGDTLPAAELVSLGLVNRVAGVLLAGFGILLVAEVIWKGGNF